MLIIVPLHFDVYSFSIYTFIVNTTKLIPFDFEFKRQFKVI